MRRERELEEKYLKRERNLAEEFDNEHKKLA
jgi:hypothetical protein